MTTPNEDAERATEELQAEYDNLVEQRNSLREQIAENDTPQLRSFLAETESSISRINNELSQAQNTPSASSSDERETINSERSAATAAADAIIQSEAAATASATGNVRSRFFEEQEHQTYHHDFIVYVQGSDVTRFVQGSISVTLGTNETTNTLSMTLNNTGDLFTITPENLAGIWRLGPDSPMSEDVKKAIFDLKNDPLRNPFDVGSDRHPGSGARRWNLAVYGCVFHRMDPVRMWVKNPVAPEDRDEWIPIFTGYVTTKGMQDGWINGDGTIQIQAVDIRDMMRHMRIDRNSVLYETPGGRNLSASMTPAGAAAANSTRSTDPTRPNPYFTSAALEQQLSRSTGQARSPSALADTLQRCNEILQREANTLGVARSLQFFADLIRNPGDTTQSWAHCDYLQITHSLTLGSEVRPIIVNPRGRDRVPQAHLASRRSNRAARGGVGRMREGLAYMYPDPDTNLGRETSRGEARAANERIASHEEDVVRNQEILSNWYSLGMFGSPSRYGCTSDPNTRLAPKLGPGDIRFWSLDEVRAAGLRTVTDDIWAPDMQLVHWLIPSQGTNARSDGIVEIGIGPDQVAGERNWTTRYDFMMEMTRTIDYRVWVTGCGDIMFEPPLYDFYPDDFGELWEDSMIFDKHLVDSQIDEEHQDVPTVYIAVGRIVAVLPSTGQSGPLQRFAPGVIPKYTMWSPVLASRFGIKVEIEDFPWIESDDKLKSIAVVRYQKFLMEADSFSCNAASRVFISPNRPFYMVPRERISLVSSVTHTWEVFGEATTQFDLHGSRYMDIYGIRRNITGGRSLPLSFSAIPGHGVYNTNPAQRVLTSRVATLLSSGITDNQIIYGDYSGTGPNLKIIYDDGRGSREERNITPEQYARIEAVRDALSHVDALANLRAENRRITGAPPSISASEILARAIDRHEIPPGRAAFNVVPGFQNMRTLNDARQLELDYRNLQSASEIANEAARAVRVALASDAYNPELGITMGATGIRSIEQIRQTQDEQQIRYRILPGTPEADGPNSESRALYASHQEGVKLNVFSCDGVPTVVGFWRAMRAAAARIIPDLSEYSRDLLICLSSIETAHGTKMHNNNVGNLKSYVDQWGGPWHVWAGSQYKSFETLEQGVLGLREYIQARVPGSHAQLVAGDARYIQTLYSRGYGENANGTAGAASAGAGYLRQLQEKLAYVRRLDNAGTIANAPSCDLSEQAVRSAELSNRANQRNADRARQARTTPRAGTPARAGTAAVPATGSPSAPGIPATPGAPAIPAAFDPSSVAIRRGPSGEII